MFWAAQNDAGGTLYDEWQHLCALLRDFTDSFCDVQCVTLLAFLGYWPTIYYLYNVRVVVID